MTDRAAYTAGLRQMADFIDANPGVALPYDGGESELSWYFQDEPGLQQALTLLSIMTDLTLPYIDVNTTTTWVDFDGRIGGVQIHVAVQAPEAWRTQPEAPEMVDRWSIPAELIEAVQTRRAAEQSDGGA